jgi:hypothetical protein
VGPHFLPNGVENSAKIGKKMGRNSAKIGRKPRENWKKIGLKNLIFVNFL